MFSIVIPSRKITNLIPCVEAIRDAGETAQIVVVWDGSSKASYIAFDLLNEVKSVVVLNGKAPFIFARNVNIGICAAEDNDVIVLNDDAFLKTPMGFTKLAETSQEHPEFGVLATACTSVGNPHQRAAFGSALREDPRMVCFVAVYIPRSTINKVGLLDEDYTGYGCDDDDYCYRTRKAGLKIGILGSVIVDHHDELSSFRGDPNNLPTIRPCVEIFKRKHGAYPL